MRSLKFWYKVTRPEQCCIAGCAAWLTALLSNGPLWFTPEKIAAGLVMFCAVLGASLIHYGLANKMYARKYWDLVEVDRPDILVQLGSLAFLFAVEIALYFLPLPCTAIVIADALAIAAYSLKLSRHWTTKNLTIAFVCTTPVLVGWLSGHRLHPVVPYLICAAFFAYLAREIIKDYTDLKANNGIRVTLPMWLGVENALRVAAVCVVACILCLLPIIGIMQDSTPIAFIPFLLAITIFGLTAKSLLKLQRVNTMPSFITAGNACMMAVTLILRLTRT